MLCITDVKNSVQEIGARALLIVSNYILGFIWRKDPTIYGFDSNSNDENANLPSMLHHSKSSKVARQIALIEKLY